MNSSRDPSHTFKRCDQYDDAVIEEEVATLPQLVERVLDVTAGNPEREWWFRGQGRSSWPTAPSLFRHVDDVNDAVQLEARVHLEFDNRSRMLAERAGARSEWELLFLMQHHRMPTRLLDWSRNLLIGTFFAVEDHVSWAQAEDPPSLFMLDPREWNTRLLGAAGMATIAGPSGVISDLTSTTAAAYAPRVPGSMARGDQPHAVAITGPEFARRIAAQRGAFIVFGTKHPEAANSLEDQDAALDGAGENALWRFKLNGERDEWRRALRVVGIGQFTAFPDLDGLATELRTSHFPT